MKIKYVCLHTLTGASEVCDFSISTREWSVPQFEEQIAQWNKRGVISGLQIWHYRLTVEL
jgi:hypothetical protein